MSINTCFTASVCVCVCPPSRRKLQAKLKELEEALAASETKYSALDKTKARMASELEDMNLDLEKVGVVWCGDIPSNYATNN